MRPARTLALAAGLTIAAAAIAAPETSPLSGPKVEDTAASPAGLGTPMDMMSMTTENGRLVAPVAELAVIALDLDEPTRAKVEAILDDRAAFVDRLVADNRTDFELLRAARMERDRAKIREITTKLQKEIMPHVERGTLEDRIAAVLPAGRVEDYRAAVEDLGRAYRDTRSAASRDERDPFGTPDMRDADVRLFDDDGMAPPERAGRPNDREADRPGRGGDRAAQRTGRGGPRDGQNSDRRAQMRERFLDSPQAKQRAEAMSIMMIEVPRAIERVFGNRVPLMDKITAAIELEPEQEAKIREMVQAFAEQHGPNAPPEARRELIQKLSAELDRDQRRALREAMQGGQFFAP